MAGGRTDGGDDAFADAGQDGLFAGTTDKLFDVGAHGDASFGNQLDTVFGNSGDGRSVDDLGVDGGLDGVEHVATGKVDGGAGLEVEVHIGFVGRNESLDDAVDAAAGQIVGLELVLRNFKAGLGCRHHIVDDDGGRHLTEAHKHKLYQRGVDTADEGLEPDSDGYKPQEEYQKNDTRENNYNSDWVHNVVF